MTENAEHTSDNQTPDQDQARAEALQRVVERVNAWQETATDGTIADELDRGLQEAGLTLTDDQRERLVAQISDGADVDVSDYNETGGGPA
ncbi:hypothetical protein IEQ44_05805 [Nocardioides sp. Y6]|uniref:Uncharacterized protein n=1 Tax=Nocardioides malaquae TaxID=2773426 RepID=A0ABR9RRG1_9ACTN|nr:hypothetical protein [Nocardioides malaquae]MBE7324160.1 hypothetical protein [Nocardioides malaquae]